MLLRRVGGVAIFLLVTTAALDAHVTELEILQRGPVPTLGGLPGVGPYEQISGKVHGELDPNDPQNAIITDIKLAPRNARGMVEYVATFMLVKPVDMSKASGVLWYTAANRGGARALPSPEGHVTLVSGWQGGLVPNASNQTIVVPVAKNPDGTSITGPFVVRFTNLLGNQNSGTSPIRVPLNQPSPYPPVTLDTTQASLISATSETAEGVKSGTLVIPGTDWAFADCATVPFPGKPDRNQICLKNGFKPDLIYELRYTVKDPLVLGIGLAATRDINSFFRYQTKDDRGTPNPVAGNVRWAIAEGISQAGTYLKLHTLLGFNQDEAGRIVWDGINPSVASRNTDLNRRFALPGGNVGLYELGHEAPSWWEDWNDSARGRGTAGVLDRCRVTNTCPKVLETFGGSEVWGLRHSYSLVGTDAKADIPLPDNVRRYYFLGVNHSGGGGGFSSTTMPARGCELSSNPAPTGPMRTALLDAFTGWVTKGTAMPPNRYPMIADGTLVAPTSTAMGFPKIPGRPSPDGVLVPLLDYDAGAGFNYRDQSGVAPQVPVVKGVLPQLVPRVDADGNEVAGVKSPLQMAPLGTYTGWNVQPTGPFKGQMCNAGGTPVGGFIPFVITKAERTASGDPRLSLEERYQTHDGYVTAVTDAANGLVKAGFLLQADAIAMIGQAQRSNVLRMPGPAPAPPPQAQSAEPSINRVGDDVAPPRKIKDVPPVYPEGARASGFVILELTIDQNGNVTNARPLRSIPALDAAAVEAARLWKFEPPMKAGVAVPVLMSAAVLFAAPPSVRVNLKMPSGSIVYWVFPLGAKGNTIEDERLERISIAPYGSAGPVEHYRIQPTLRAGSTTEVTVSVSGDNQGTIDVKLGGGYAQAAGIPFSIELVDVVLDFVTAK